MNNWNNKQTEDLLQAILALKNLEEARNFFRDLLTEQELVEFGKRWQTAKMLNANVPYSEIAKQTGLSSTTIARVSQWLNQGMGGYTLALKRSGLHHHLLPSKRSA